MLTKPTRQSVYIKNLQKNVFINFITIDDEAWIAENFPGNVWEESFGKSDFNPSLSIFWRLLDNDAKKAIYNVKFVEWENGKEVEKTIVDPVERLKKIISGADEVMAIVSAILQTKALSLPDFVATAEKKKTVGADSPITK